jgi:hypothetical protein
VSTVGRDETVIREYIRRQEQADKCLDQINPWRSPATERCLKKSEPRWRPRTAASSGSQPKAPGFAGGYLL